MNKLITFVLMFMMMFSLASAFDIWTPSTWDDNVVFHETGKGGNLGYYEINDTTFWLFKNKPIKRIDLIENDYSILHAWNIKEIEVFKTTKLFDKTKYLDKSKTINRGQNIKSESQLYRELETKTRTVGDIYCNEYEFIENETGGVNVCVDLIDTTYQEEYTVWGEWENYHFQAVHPGLYQTKTIVERVNIRTGVMEWVDDSEGHSLVEWASWWDTDWEYKREISVLNTSNEITGLYNITWVTHMKTDFGDIRFLDYATESTELNYTIITKTDSTSAMVRVFSDNQDKVYMYYGNSIATTTQSFDDLYFAPTHAYTFDTGLTDDSSNSLTATNTGATPLLSSILGSLYYFDGNDFMDIGDPISSALSDFTLSAWINYTGDTDDRVMGKYWDGSKRSFDWYAKYTGSCSSKWGLIASFGDGESGTTATYCANSIVPSNTPTMLTITFTGGTLQFYINGVADGTTNSLSDLYDNNADLRFGRDNFNGGGSAYLTGTLDEIYLDFDHAWTPAQVLIAYKQSEPSFVVGSEQANNQPPVVTLSSPANDTTINSNSYSASFVNHVTDADSTISNCTLNVWNITDDTLEYTQTDTSITNDTDITFIQVLASSNYTWNVLCTDSVGSSAYATANWTINVIPIPDNPPIVTLGLPVNNSIFLTSPVDLNFTCNASDDVQLDNVSLYIDNVLNVTNSSGINNTQYEFNMIDFTDGNYIWSCGAVDNSSQETRPDALMFTVHLDTPEVEITAPINDTIVLEINQSINLTWSITDFDLDTCWYNIGGANITVNCLDNYTTFNYPISSPDNLTIILYANDSVNRPDSDSVIIFKDTTSPSVAIDSPVEGFNVTAFNQSVQLNWTITDNNLDSCWYRLGEEEKISIQDTGTLPSVLFDNNYTTSFNPGYINSSYFFDVVGSNINGTILNVTTFNTFSSVINDYQIGLVGCTNSTINASRTCTVSGADCDWSFSCGDSFLSTISTVKFEQASQFESYTGANITVNCSDGFTTINYPNNNPDNLTVYMIANDTMGNSDSDNVTIYKSTSEPVLNVTSPSGDFPSLNGGVPLQLNWTVVKQDVDVGNCSYRYNGVTTFVDCDLNATTFNYSVGVNNITMFAESTLGAVTNDTTNWSALFESFQINYTSPVYEGLTNNINSTIRLREGESITASYLSYNGVNYSSIINYDGDTNEYLLTSFPPAPDVSVETNITIRYFAEVGGTFYSTHDDINQTVLPISLTNCSTGEILINVSMYDERLRTALSSDIEYLFRLKDAQNDNTIETYNSSETSVYYIAVCIDPIGAKNSYVLDAELKYTASDYAFELYFIDDALLTDYPKNLSLFILSLNDSTEFVVTYRDDNLIKISDAIIQLQRKYISLDLFETVEAPKTSNNGETVLHIDLDTNNYRAVVVKDGVVLDIFESLVFSCENELSGICTEQLLGEIDPQNSVSVDTLNDFTYSISETNDIVTTLFSVPSGTPKTVVITLTQQDAFGQNHTCSNTVLSSSGSIDCDIEDTLGDSLVSVVITQDGKTAGIKEFLFKDEPIDYLGNNFFIVFIFMLSIVGMAYSSPEWMIINTIVTLLLAGAFWLVNGVDFVIGFGGLLWLIIGSGIILIKLTKQEDR